MSAFDNIEIKKETKTNSLREIEKNKKTSINNNSNREVELPKQDKIPKIPKTSPKKADKKKKLSNKPLDYISNEDSDAESPRDNEDIMVNKARLKKYELLQQAFQNEEPIDVDQ